MSSGQFRTGRGFTEAARRQLQPRRLRAQCRHYRRIVQTPYLQSRGGANTNLAENLRVPRMAIATGRGATQPGSVYEDTWSTIAARRRRTSTCSVDREETRVPTGKLVLTGLDDLQQRGAAPPAGRLTFRRAASPETAVGFGANVATVHFGSSIITIRYRPTIPAIPFGVSGQRAGDRPGCRYLAERMSTTDANASRGAAHRGRMGTRIELSPAANQRGQEWVTYNGYVNPYANVRRAEQPGQSVPPLTGGNSGTVLSAVAPEVQPCEESHQRPRFPPVRSGRRELMQLHGGPLWIRRGCRLGIPQAEAPNAG